MVLGHAPEGAADSPGAVAVAVAVTGAVAAESATAVAAGADDTVVVVVVVVRLAAVGDAATEAGSASDGAVEEATCGP